MPDPRASGIAVKSVAGGLLVQSRDVGQIEPHEFRTVTRRAPSETELADLRFSFSIAKHVKSNAIVYAKQGATVGIGAGQMSRVDSVRIAALKAADAARAAGAMSRRRGARSLPPMPSSPSPMTAASRRGRATAVIQPGGSLRDQEVIAPPMKQALPWSSPACAISAINFLPR